MSNMSRLSHGTTLMCWTRSDAVLVHACSEEEQTDTLCGLSVARTGPPWPVTTGLWDIADGRCSACARTVYTVER